MGPRTQFLYLSEPDMIEAGVLDAAHCVDVCEDVFKLLATGDYLMGGPNHNSHGMGIEFPKESSFPNMPTAGPDRRFVAMPGYLGGRFDVCGVKWYGSNHSNPSVGLPRSVLTVQLNNKETGEPLSLMSANLLSAARTGAVPAVATRYLADKNATTIAILGCGPINRACFTAIVSQLPRLQKVYCYDLFDETAQAFVDFSMEKFGIEGILVTDLRTALADAHVVSVAASRVKPLIVEEDWFAPGATILVSGPITSDDALWTNSRLVLDNVQLHKAYVEDAEASSDREAYYDGVIGGPIYRLIDTGRLPPLDESTDLGNVILGSGPPRGNDEHRTVFVACGMSVFDLAWGYEIYQNALKNGIGVDLPLWDEPYVG